MPPGNDWIIDFFIEDNGKDPVNEFIDNLPLKVQAKIEADIEYLMDAKEAIMNKGHKAHEERRQKIMEDPEARAIYMAELQKSINDHKRTETTRMRRVAAPSRTSARTTPAYAMGAKKRR